jgi:hypothetical protein
MEKEIEKLAVLLNHWIKHNEDHTKEYRKWADTSYRHGLKEVADNLRIAADLILKSNEIFIAAKKGMPISSHEEEHSHD